MGPRARDPACFFVFPYLRKRKEGICKTVYLQGMDTDQLTVEEILKKWPQTFSIFKNRNTGCIGCFLQRFCTLQDVAETYGVSLQEMKRDLEI